MVFFEFIALVSVSIIIRLISKFWVLRILMSF